ncbi:MAG: hypothetical protein JWN15_2438 [Firmicutes bacterium]|nr:hypothetical protein [Bacillota bacterium]
MSHGRRVNRQENNQLRPLSRREREHLKAHLASMPAYRAEAFRALQDHPRGRARLRDAGYCSRTRGAPLTAQERTRAEQQLGGRGVLAGVEVDLTALVRRMASSPSGREALRRRMTP